MGNKAFHSAWKGWLMLFYTYYESNVLSITLFLIPHT